MLKPLKYKNEVMEGFFISKDGKIFDSNGVEQEQYLCSSRPYYYFKGHKVHQMMAHSFYGYKPGYDIHHLNLVKTDNSLSNLIYLTREQHVSLHKTGKNHPQFGKKQSPEQIQKKSKKVYCSELNKVFDSIKQASRGLSLAKSSICKCCKGKYKSAGGYHFEYFN